MSSFPVPDAISCVKTYFGMPPDDVFARPGICTHMRMHFPSTRFIDIPLDGWQVWRSLFDQWLCDRSEARILDKTEFLSFSEDAEGVSLTCNTRNVEIKSETLVIRCKVCIAADGGTSKVAGIINPIGRKNLRWSLAVQDMYEGTCNLEPGYWHFFADPDISGYPCAYIKDDLIIMDVGMALGDKASPHIERFKDFLKNRFEFSPEKLIRRMGCRVTFPAPQGVFSFGTKRVLIAGEASGLFNLFGEGISSALASGHIAGRIAAQSIERQCAPDAHYQKEIEEDRCKTAQQFSLKSMLADTRIKGALDNLPLFKRLSVMKDLMKWALFSNKMNQGGLPNKTGHH